jgi:hypothetical protein
MKKIGLLGIIACLVIAAFGFMSYKQTLATVSDTGAFLMKAFGSTNAEVEGYTINNWSVIDAEFRTPDQLKRMAETVNATLQIENAKGSPDTQGDQNAYTLRGTFKDGADVQLVLKSMKFQEHAPQTVLVVSLDHATKDLSEYAKEITIVRNTAKAAKSAPQISTCIKGLLADKMKSGDSNALVKDVFRTVNAKEIEGVRSDLVTSVSGYSPLTKDYIFTNGTKMNIQVAVHYDAYQGKTRVLVGSPIVTIEY